MLELHAGLLANRLFTALLAKYREPLKSESIDFRLGQNFLLQADTGTRLASLLIDRAGTSFDGNTVLDAQERRNPVTNHSSHRLYSYFDSMVRRLLRDKDGKKNSVANANYYGVFDFGMAAAKTLAANFDLPEDCVASVENYKGNENLLGIEQGNLLAFQSNPFASWSYFERPHVSDPNVKQATLAAEFFTSNMARAPYQEKKRLYELLLEGAEDLDLPQLIQQMLADTKLLATTNLHSLEMSLVRLHAGCEEELITASGGRLKRVGELSITDVAVRNALQSQVKHLQAMATEQLQTVEACQASKGCLLAYLIQALVVTDEMVPVIQVPMDFKPVKPADVVAWVLPHDNLLKRNRPGHSTPTPQLHLL